MSGVTETRTDEQIRPYRIEISDNELADLYRRLARVRWAPEPAGGDKGYGVPSPRSAGWSSTRSVTAAPRPDDADCRGSWTETVGVESHGIRIETNAHDLTLVFPDLRVAEPAPGCATARGCACGG